MLSISVIFSAEIKKVKETDTRRIVYFDFIYKSIKEID